MQVGGVKRTAVGSLRRSIVRLIPERNFKLIIKISQSNAMKEFILQLLTIPAFKISHIQG